MKTARNLLIPVFSALMIFSLTACSAQINGEKQPAERNVETENAIPDKNDLNKNNEKDTAERRIKVTTKDGSIIVFALNDSQASRDLYGQLPITVEVNNFSNNEKIFYPADKLNTKNTPNPSSVNAGTLAYYRP